MSALHRPDDAYCGCRACAEEMLAATAKHTRRDMARLRDVIDKAVDEELAAMSSPVDDSPFQGRVNAYVSYELQKPTDAPSRALERTAAIFARVPPTANAWDAVIELAGKYERAVDFIEARYLMTERGDDAGCIGCEGGVSPFGFIHKPDCTAMAILAEAGR